MSTRVCRRSECYSNGNIERCFAASRRVGLHLQLPLLHHQWYQVLLFPMLRVPVQPWQVAVLQPSRQVGSICNSHCCIISGTKCYSFRRSNNDVVVPLASWVLAHQPFQVGFSRSYPLTSPSFEFNFLDSSSF